MASAPHTDRICFSCHWVGDDFDGFIELFGRLHGKKFMVSNLRELIVDNANLPMDQLRYLLEKALASWNGEKCQVDDVTILGIEII